MSGRIPDSFIDELLARTDIVELIGSRVPVKKAGREYHARCPFHDERSPSFTVSPTKQFYHCFGCGAHGSAIKFLMEYDRMEFVDAVEELAHRAGVEVPRDVKAAPRGQFDELLLALDAAAKFFQSQLNQSDKAKQYLKKRGLDEAILSRFMVGYAPDSWDALKNFLGHDEAKLKAIDRAGLLSTGERGKSYDKFRDRIMFPIHDRRGRVIAFGGRVIEKDDSPKYLNSPETPLFHKGRELFGLHQVRLANNKLSRLIVVEGYMDVISLFQFGVTQAVATLGTATTKDHAELLFRNAADVFFCFDGDKAGRSAAWRAVESVLPRMRDGRQAHFLFLPEGEDPDSIVRKENLNGFETRLKNATPLSDFFFDSLQVDVNLSSIDGKARFAERCKPLIAQIPDGAFRDLMQSHLEHLTGLNSNKLKIETTQLKTDYRARHQAPPKNSLVRTTIAMLVQKPSLVASLDRDTLFGNLRQPGVELLIELIALAKARPDLSTGSLLEHFTDRSEQSALNKVAMQNIPTDPSLWVPEFLGAIEQLEKQTRKQRRDDLLTKEREGALTSEERGELRELFVGS